MSAFIMKKFLFLLNIMDPKYMEWMSTQVKNGKSLYCPNGSHLAMWDDQKVFMDGVIKFIKDVDGK